MGCTDIDKARAEACRASIDARIIEELAPIDAEAAFLEWMEEWHGEVEICGLPYSAARVLREIDPTAWRSGLVDFIDEQVSSERWTDEIGGAHYDFGDAERVRDEWEAEHECEDCGDIIPEELIDTDSGARVCDECLHANDHISAADAARAEG